MANVLPLTQKLLSAQLEQLAREVELATAKRRLEIAQERSETVSRSIRPIYDVFADS